MVYLVLIVLTQDLQIELCSTVASFSYKGCINSTDPSPSNARPCAQRTPTARPTTSSPRSASRLAPLPSSGPRQTHPTRGLYLFRPACITPTEVWDDNHSINRLLLITREVEVPIVPQFLVPVPLNDILGKLELSSVPVPRIERNCEELRSWISDPPLPANHSLSTTSCSRRILGVGCMGAMLDNMRTRHQDQISHLQPARLRRDAVRWQWNRNWQLPRWDYGN